MTIIVRCEECEKRYRVPDERAGKRVKCKECGTILLVPPLDEPPRAPDGTNIYRHEARSREFELVAGNEENIESISKHIEKWIGPVESVFHELISDMVHIDVHWVRPAPDRPCHVLITSGMSDRPMTVPDQCTGYEYAELMISLPEDWPISSEDFEDEDNYWPVRLLKMMARLPHEYETWLGMGHTVPNGDPPEPYAPATKFCCALVMPPIGAFDGVHSLKLEDGRIIRFYSLIPLYLEEVNFKLSKGLDALMSRFDKAHVSEIVNVNRPNCCKRKKWFGLF